MPEAVRFAGLLAVGAVAATLLAMALAWWMEPRRRAERAVRALLGAAPDEFAIAPVRGQALGVSTARGKLAVVSGRRDPGLVFGFDELIGVELALDDKIVARAFRDEGRKPLDHLAPDAASVVLRLVFDDLRDPDFHLELVRPGDPEPDPAGAVALARRLLARGEAIVRRPVMASRPAAPAQVAARPRSRPEPEPDPEPAPHPDEDDVFDAQPEAEARD